MHLIPAFTAELLLSSVSSIASLIRENWVPINIAHILNQIIICKDIFFHPNEGIEDDSINLVIAFRELCFDYYKLLNNEDFIERERKKFELQLSLSSLIKKLNLNKIRYSSYLDDLSKRLNISITAYSNNDRATIYQIDENNEPIYTDHDI